MECSLPDAAPCSWSGETLRLKYPVPKIWTQKSSRSFGIYWSDKLSFGRLWPAPTEEELNTFYDISSYSEYLSGRRKHQSKNASLLTKAATKLAWLNDHGITNPVPTILRLAIKNPQMCDIGCGSGGLLSLMRDAGAVVTGVDPSEVSAAAVRAKNIEFYAGTAETLPVEINGRRFDVVSMFQSLEHCRSPALAITNAISLLKEDGLLIVDVPNMGCLGFDTYGPAWWHADAGRHLQFFSKASLEALLGQSGATPVQWEYCGFVNQFTPSWIDDMREAWDGVYDGRPNGIPRPSLTRSLAYMPHALVASDDKKYEIIRVYARRSVR
jgi:SAM-dependent methyltransferase